MIFPAVSPFVGRGPCWRLAAWAKFPEIRLGRFTIQPGEESWQAALLALTPVQRQHAARILGGMLVPLLAPGKVKAWREARRGKAKETREQRLERIQRELPVFGDISVERPALAGLMRLPEPVADYVAATAMVLGVGKKCGAWTGPLLPERRPVVLDAHGSDAYVEALMVHEACHQWVAEDAPGQMLRTAAGHAFILEHSEEERAATEEEEKIVRLVSLGWLCRPGDFDARMV